LGGEFYTSVSVARIKGYLCETARMKGEVSSNAQQMLRSTVDKDIPSTRFIVVSTVVSMWR